jgi:two-component system response regulator GlrR
MEHRNTSVLEFAGQEEKTAQTLTEKLGMQQLIGQSEVFVAEISKIPLIAKSDISVLISGETGTGKEMVGRAIHYLSPRAGKSFVPVNCGAIPVELLENELFGHASGAFTGASGARDGLIQEADKGTLFLDEVDCLPPLAQVKLLRFLQSKEFRPLGSTKVITGDVRIVAASNANLEQAVAAGTLRRDLYYRLNVVPIVLPPLRERSSDISLLARHFLAEYAAKLDSPAEDFSPEAERKLMLYDWPGNVRELENAIERAIVLGTTEVILPEDLPEAALEADVPATGGVAKYHEAVAEAKKQLILKAVEQAGGNYTEAAKLLGVHPNYLHRLIRNMNLRPEIKK